MEPVWTTLGLGSPIFLHPFYNTPLPPSFPSLNYQQFCVPVITTHISFDTLTCEVTCCYRLWRYTCITHQGCNVCLSHLLCFGITVNMCFRMSHVYRVREHSMTQYHNACWYNSCYSLFTFSPSGLLISLTFPPSVFTKYLADQGH